MTLAHLPPKVIIITFLKKFFLKPSLILLAIEMVSVINFMKVATKSPPSK